MAYELGPGRTITELAHAFERLAERGVLHITHPLRAASDFNWLLMSDPISRAMFLVENELPEPASIDTWAKEAYTPSSPSTSADCCRELFSPQGGGDDVVADCMDEATVGPLPLGALNISYDPFRVDSPYRPASPIFSPLGFMQPNRSIKQMLQRSCKEPNSKRS